MICELCELRIPDEEPNNYTGDNNMCYDCWVWLE